MKGKPSLYEVLGVAPGAVVAEIHAAFRRQMNALEAQRAALAPAAFDERAQLLRLACNTLVDPVSRGAYDARLQAAAGAAPAAVAARSLALSADGTASPAAVRAEVQADALSLRADALSLRADAMLARAGAGLPREELATEKRLARGALAGLSHLSRAIGLLFIIGVVTFMVARCSFSGSEGRSNALNANAAERAALQEYYQTYGVRPASMAELELLQAERRRKENEERQAQQDRRRADEERRRQEDAQRRFEEDAKRRGREVSEDLRRAEEQQRFQALREEETRLREEQTRLAREQVQRERERLRIESEQRQWRDTLRR